MNTSELNNNSDLFPAFVAKHNAPDLYSDLVKNERELGEWYANYDSSDSWFESGTLYVRNFHGRVSERCTADSEDEAYLEMARRSRDEAVWVINEASLIDVIEDGDAENIAELKAMLEKLREVKN